MFIWGLPYEAISVSLGKLMIPGLRRRIIIFGLLVLAQIGASNSFSAENGHPAGPLVGKNADGRLELFSINELGELRHRWQKRAAGDWSSWSSLGRELQPGFALNNATEGRQVLFALDRADGSMKWIHQVTTNSLEWSEWSDLGGSFRPPLAVARTDDGRLVLFAADSSRPVVRYIWQTGALGSWSEWRELPGQVQGGLEAIRDREGRLELFGLEAASGHLVHCEQVSSNSMSQWTPWEDLGQAVLPDFVVAQNVRGMVEVFGMSSSGHLQRLCRDQANGWRAWEEIGEDLKPGFAVGQSIDGRLEIFAVNARTNLLLHRWEMLPDGSDQWSVWATMEQKARPYPAVGQNEDGNLEVFAMDVDDAASIYHRRQISKASGWLDWTSLDQPIFEYNSRTWQVDEGLPSDLVQAITQTRDGYLWIGTHNGLARFDGVVFNPGPPELSQASITALCADASGSLWIGTDGEGLFRLTGTTMSRFSRTNGLAADHVRVIHETREGSIWVGTTNGLSRYRNDKFRNYTMKEGLLSDSVSYIYEDRDRNLWIATGGGLNRLRGETMDAFKMPNNLPNDSVRVICQDRGGRIWIGSNNGMLWYNAYWGKSFFAYNTRYGLSDSFVSAICEDVEGNLWVGTYSGLNRFREGRFFPTLNNEGVPFDKVNTLFEDREGNLWVGSVEGLVRLTPKRFFTYTKKNGLSHNNITSVLEDRDGSVWIGTWGGGLNRLKDEKVQCFNSTNGLPSDLVLSLCEGRDGSIWAGADFDGGLSRIQGRKITRYSSRNGLPSAPIRVLFEDRSSQLWVGTARGVVCFKAGRFENYATNNALAGSIRAICQDHQGALWFGSETGLTCLDHGRFTRFDGAQGLSDDSVTSLYQDNKHDLWIGTAAGGLNRYMAGHFRSYTASQGLFSDQILEVLEDGQGWLWLSCEKGVFRVRKSELNEFDKGQRGWFASIAYGQNDGIESTHCNGLAKPAGWRTRDGRLLFATSKGLTGIYPATAPVSTSAPPVYIQQVFADKKLLADTGPLIYGGLESRRAVAVAAGRGELEFRYTALSFQAPESCRFRYKLEGVDSEWVEAGTRRVAHYNNVYPGHYRFLVAACNKEGIWNETGDGLSMDLAPHLWQTWWWRTLTVASLIAVAGGTARYFTAKKMQRKLERLEQRHAIERERGRIAKDIHDDLGSSLTRIMMLGERAEEGLGSDEDVAPHVRKIVTSARNTVQSLDEIVWAVNPENDTLEGLIEYISHYANEFFENTTVSCRLEIPVQLPSFVLPAELRHDLFLVVKEAFNNILKHAQASAVQVWLAVEGAFIQVTIEDNGRGFDPEAVVSGRQGNGLANMRKRIAAVGGQFSIVSAPGQGTRLKLSAKLPAEQVVQ